MDLFDINSDLDEAEQLIQALNSIQDLVKQSQKALDSKQFEKMRLLFKVIDKRANKAKVMLRSVLDTDAFSLMEMYDKFRENESNRKPDNGCRS